VVVDAQRTVVDSLDVVASVEAAEAAQETIKVKTISI
jgi:hypothetical protein